MTLINAAVFERHLEGRPILFETFWDWTTMPSEYCTGFSLTINWSKPNPADVEAIRRLAALIDEHEIGIHLERTATTRKIHFGIVNTPCYDPEEHKTVISLAELELERENTPAFDWLFESMEAEEREDMVYAQWPRLRTSIIEGTYYELEAEIPSRSLDPPLQTDAVAGATVRLFVNSREKVLLTA